MRFNGTIFLGWVLSLLLLTTARGADIPAGFTPLFNGKDLGGWHVSRIDHHGSTPDASVKDGVLQLRQSPYGQGGLLLTNRRYQDFELYVEVKAPWGCNSGIFLRSTEGGTAYQIELDQGRGTGNLLGENLAVSTTAEASSLKNAWKEGDWNSFLIRIDGATPHISEWINGRKMWEVQERRNDKIADETDGMIGLQAHWASTYEPAQGSFNLPGSWKPGAAYQFRNIAIKQLHSSSSNASSAGIELVLIKPGQMQEAVFQPVCPDEQDAAVKPSKGEAVDRKILWTSVDLARCRTLAERDGSAGFQVTIAKPFYIGKFEITQGQWTKVMGTNPSVFQGSKVADDASRHPVENVSWDNAQAFIKRLNEMEKTNAYRLPTEFEWEYAGRAGGRGQVSWDEIRQQAVQGLRAADGNGAKPTTQMVGSKQPNAWGLYDMLGNVWEWVQDYYNEKTFPDPDPPTHGTQHVLKGAGFVSDVKNAIYATHGAGPGDGWDVGFRIAKDVDASPSTSAFISNCASCHGTTARGGAHGGPDLMQSNLVRTDEDGKQLGAFLKVGRSSKGMPAFNLSDDKVQEIAAFLHSASRENDGGTNVLVGDATAGKVFFHGEGHCVQCHLEQGDLKGVGSKYSPAVLQGRLVLPIGDGGYPGLYPSEAPKTGMTVIDGEGKTVTGLLAFLSDYAVTVVEASGQRRTFARHGDSPKITIDDPLQAHLDRQLILNDMQMHDLTAYLATLK